MLLVSRKRVGCTPGATILGNKVVLKVLARASISLQRSLSLPIIIYACSKSAAARVISTAILCAWLMTATPTPGVIPIKVNAVCQKASNGHMK